MQRRVAGSRHPRHQLDLDSSRRVGERHADRRARRWVLGEVVPVNSIHRRLLRLHVGEEDGHLQHVLQRRAQRFQVRLVRLENLLGLFLDVAAKRQRVLARRITDAGQPGAEKEIAEADASPDLGAATPAKVAPPPTPAAVFTNSRLFVFMTSPYR